MRTTSLSVLLVLLWVAPAFAQRDAPVWEAYLPQVLIYHDEVSSNRAITVDFLFKKNGGPHEHTQHQAYMLVYLKKDEEQILKLAADPQLISKKNEKTKKFLDLLIEKKLVVSLDTQVAKITESSARYADVRGTPKRAGAATREEFTFPFKFTFSNETLFQSVQKLGSFNVKSVNVAGSSEWFDDKFKLIVFVPVNDSAHATKVPSELHKMYDFANVMNFESALLYFRPLPYEFGFKRYAQEPILIYIN